MTGKRERISIKQAMRILNRSCSGLSRLGDKLKPIPRANVSAPREYWKDEVLAFKEANPVTPHKQRAGRKSRRVKHSLTDRD